MELEDTDVLQVPGEAETGRKSGVIELDIVVHAGVDLGSSWREAHPGNACTLSGARSGGRGGGSGFC